LGKIYCIKNESTGELYIGKTTQSLKERFCQHKNDSKRKLSHGCKKLYSSINKYGEENFSIKEIETVPDNSLEEREQYWINKLDTVTTGLNTIYGNKKYNSEIIDNIINEYNSGKSIKKISEKFKLHPDTISKAFAENNIKIRGGATYLGKEVKMLDINGNFKRSFNSIREAGRYLIKEGLAKGKNTDGISGKISLVINGKRRSAYKHLWAC
jgi:group I intron endonuclease